MDNKLKNVALGLVALVALGSFAFSIHTRNTINTIVSSDSGPIVGGITRTKIGAQTAWTTDLIPSTSFTVNLGSSANKVSKVFFTNASGSFAEFTSTASASAFKGSAFPTSNCSGSTSALQWATTGLFTCGTISAAAGGTNSNIPFVTIGNTASLSFERALTGTANQITITDNGVNSSVVLSIPALFSITAASTSTNFEAIGYASASKYFGGALAACASQKALQWATTGLFGCSGDFQSLDATLTSLAAYNTNGLLTQTAADTFTGRTVTGTTDQITVTNGNGVSGNPTLSIPNPFVMPGIASASTKFELTGLNALASISGQFNVGGFTKLAGSIAQLASSTNNFVQLNIQNFSNGASASSDLVITGDRGSNTSQYLNLGLNGSAYRDYAYDIVGLRDGYLFTSDNDLAIGTASTSQAVGLKFFVGGTRALNQKFSMFTTGASLSLPLEITGKASVSGAFVQNSVASNSFLGSISGPTTGTLSVGTSDNPLKIFWSNIVRAVVSFFFPTTTSTTATLTAAGQAVVNTASKSLDIHDGTNQYIDPFIKCFPIQVDTPTSTQPSTVGHKRFSDPFTITSISVVASGSNAAGWNAKYGAPGSVTTTVFTSNHSASTSTSPTYTSFANSTIADGNVFDIVITSRSAVLQNFTPTVCGRYTK